MGGSFLPPEQLKQQTRWRAVELQRLAAWRLERLAVPLATHLTPFSSRDSALTRTLQAAHAPTWDHTHSFRLALAEALEAVGRRRPSAPPPLVDR